MTAAGHDLILDIGNSRTKAALFLGERVVRWSAWDNDDPRLEAFLEKVVPERVGVGSVANVHMPAPGKAFKSAPVVLTGSSASPLRMGYTTPATLGVDRLANAVAAAAMFPGRSVLAIDLGTCITYDLVDAHGTYHGGAIGPGAGMRARAMHEFSDLLPLVELTDEAALVGNSTNASLLAGVLHGVRFELHGFIAALREQWPDLGVVLTGGDAVRFARALESGIFADPLLTLRGLHVLLAQHPSASIGRR